ncbi:MAG: precorrin-2 C(20)-methyltransferase [Thermodesulfobacteria bacterium]|nr:precorrin-2 C(20)-methyltransferase [Thermodesulfobacteriota bacterium]
MCKKDRETAKNDSLKVINPEASSSKGASSATGTLYAIGVGPGDPELITLKASKILGSIKYLFAATSKGEKESLALKIAMPHVKNGPEIIPLMFPMVRDKEALEKAWNEAAKKVCEPLFKGMDAAFVTLGDPSTYSTFTYLHRKLKAMAPGLKVEIIPGITSFQAAAARLQVPLAEAEESLAVVSGAKGSREIRQILPYCDNLVIMKAYRHYGEIVRCLEEMGLAQKTMAVRRVGLEGESVTTRLKEWDGQKPSYFTLLLTKKGKREKKLHDS